jgi:Cof subfamily protein (haloacid dehalogenase superfamily)
MAVAGLPNRKSSNCQETHAVSTLMTGPDHADERPLTVDPIAMVAADLDGTLLRGDGSLGVATSEGVFEAVRRGIRFVLATGRPPRTSTPVWKALGLDTLQVNHNGALIYDAVANRVLYHQTIEAAVAAEVVRIVRAVAPDVAIGIDVIDRCFIDSPKRRLAAIPEVGLDMAKASPIREALSQPVTKLFLLGEPGMLGSVQVNLQQKLGDKLSFAFSHMRLLQIMHRDVDKARALERVAGHYHIDRRQVMTVGDAPNDIGMLQWAGLGIAVANAFEEVRRSASFVVSNNDDDGVGEALRRYVLGG